METTETYPAPGRPVWLSIPEGYAELPLTDIPDTIEVARQLITEVGSTEQQETAAFVLDTLTVLLQTLADRRAIYCGIGRHQSGTGGQLITSSLVATVLDFPGERNPRLILRDLLLAKARDHQTGQADIIEMPDGPVAFFEHVLNLPSPGRPGRDSVDQRVFAGGTDTPVWQLEAFVPSPTGDSLVTIEASTSFVNDGPQYRWMVAAMAAGVSFSPPAETDALAALLG